MSQQSYLFVDNVMFDVPIESMVLKNTYCTDFVLIYVPKCEGDVDDTCNVNKIHLNFM